MRRAVLDSSVLVSAFISPRGTVADMLDALLASPVELCLSGAILEETARTLLTKPKLRRYATFADPDVEAWLSWLSRVTVRVEPVAGLFGVCRDPADDVIVATAVSAEAEMLITGDDDLLTLNSYQGIAIVTTREVLVRLARRED